MINMKDTDFPKNFLMDILDDPKEQEQALCDFLCKPKYRANMMYKFYFRKVDFHSEVLQMYYIEHKSFREIEDTLNLDDAEAFLKDAVKDFREDTTDLNKLIQTRCEEAYQEGIEFAFKTFTHNLRHNTEKTIADTKALLPPKKTNADENPYLQYRLDEFFSLFHLPPRCRHLTDHFPTVKALVSAPRSKVQLIGQVGRGSLMAVEDALNEVGLSLRKDDD